MTSYDAIYQRFLNKITSFRILELSDSDVQEMMSMWLTSAISKFRKCKSDLSKRDDEILEFEEDLLDEEQEILALLMVNEWLEPQINSELYINQFYGGKEEKLWSYKRLPRFAAFGNIAVYSFGYAGTPLEM